MFTDPGGRAGRGRNTFALLYWQEAFNNGGINNVVPVTSFSVRSSIFGQVFTNIDARIGTAGTGALIAATGDPDGSATLGNKRGAKAVDLGLNRTTATNVASGAQSGIFAGTDLKATATASVAVGGNTNNVGSVNGGAFCGTANTVSTGAQAVTLGGTSLSATGVDAVATGNTTAASGAQSFTAGANTVANAAQSAAFGNTSTTRLIIGSFARASGPTGIGKQQAIDLVLRGTTTDAATAIVLTSNGGGAAATNQFLLPTGTGLKVRAQLIGKNAATGDCVWFDLSGACKNVATVVTLSGTSVPTAANGDAALLTCTCAVVADNTNKCLSITVNGVAATTIGWVCEVTSAENNT